MSRSAFVSRVIEDPSKARLASGNASRNRVRGVCGRSLPDGTSVVVRLRPAVYVDDSYGVVDVGGPPDRLLRRSDGRGVVDHVQPTRDGRRVARDRADAERPRRCQCRDGVHRVCRHVPRTPRRWTRSRIRITGGRFCHLCGRHGEQRIPVPAASPRELREARHFEHATRRSGRGVGRYARSEVAQRASCADGADGHRRSRARGNRRAHGAVRRGSSGRRWRRRRAARRRHGGPSWAPSGRPA